MRGTGTSLIHLMAVWRNGLARRIVSPKVGGSNPSPATPTKKKGKERNAIYSSDKRNELDKEIPVLLLHSEKLVSL